MSQIEKSSDKRTKKRINTSIKRDGVHPRDWLMFNKPWACEDCSHFDEARGSCTLGYNPSPHLRETQRKSYELSGKIAFCRFLEID